MVNLVVRFLGVVFTSALLLNAQHQIEQTPANETKGRRLFQVSCAPCHGRTGEGAQGQVETMRPPDLTRSRRTPEELFRIISKGVPNTPMPAFEQLGAEQVSQLVLYVSSLSGYASSAKGNAAEGEKLYWGKGGCGGCHAVGSKGVAFGPDLTLGGRRSSPEMLRKAIVSPDDDIARGYEVAIVTTRDGKTIAGLSRSYDLFSARVMEPGGAERTFLREEVVSIKREMRSLMPSDYGQRLTPAELEDLIAYVVSLRLNR